MKRSSVTVLMVGAIATVHANPYQEKIGANPGNVIHFHIINNSYRGSKTNLLLDLVSNTEDSKKKRATFLSEPLKENSIIKKQFMGFSLLGLAYASKYLAPLEKENIIERCKNLKMQTTIKDLELQRDYIWKEKLPREYTFLLALKRRNRENSLPELPVEMKKHVFSFLEEKETESSS